MATWTIALDFQDGEGARDITAYVVQDSFRRERVWANGLAPASSQLTFSIHRNATIANLFLTTATKDILVAVTKDGSGYFRGIVQNQFEVGIGVRLHPVAVKCVDRGELLRRKITTTFAWVDYEVCTPAATSTSIVHQLLTLAGFESTDWTISAVINKTIDYFVNIAQDGRTYWEVLEQLLFEFGYVFYFDAAGDFCLGELWPATATSTQTFDESSLVGDVRIGKQARRYEGVRVEWAAHKTLSDAIVFSDTTGGDETYKCNIPVAASDWYPDGCEDFSVYCEYSVEGRDLVYVSGAAVDSVLETGLAVDTFTSYYRRALLKIQNSGGSTAYIKKLDIVGDAVVRGDPRFTTVEFVAGTEHLHEIKAEYLTASADVTAFASGVCRHYRYGYITYEFRSRTLVEPGAICTIQDPILGMDNLVRIATRADNEVTAEATYTAYGLAAYSAETPATVGTVTPPVSMPPPTTPHRITVAASGYQGVADWYCDGSDDDVQIQAANDYLVAAYGGGTIELTEGGYVIEAAVSLSSSVRIIGRGKGNTLLEKNCNDYGLKAVGTSGTHLENVAVESLTITRNSSDTNAKALLYFYYVDGLTVAECEVLDSKSDGIHAENCTKVQLGKNVITDAVAQGIEVVNCTQVLVSDNMLTGVFSLAAIYVNGGAATIARNTIYGTDPDYEMLDTDAIILYDTTGSIVSENVIERYISRDHGRGIVVTSNCYDCVVKTNTVINTADLDWNGTHAAIADAGTRTKLIGNICRDNGNLLVFGACKSSTASNTPYIRGDLSGGVTNCSATIVLSSYLRIQKSSAAGGGDAVYRFHDHAITTTTDLCSLVPGTRYKVSAFIAGDLATYTNFTLRFSYYSDGAWTDVDVGFTSADTMAAGENVVSDEVDIPVAATGIRMCAIIASAEAAAKQVGLFFVRLQPLGQHNEHLTQLRATGSNMSGSGNSWQTPFAV